MSKPVEAFFTPAAGADNEPNHKRAAASPYFFDGPLRKVYPYNHTYLTYAKERWRGRQLLEIFSTEFRDRSKDFYEWAIGTGTVMVNGKVATAEYIVRNGDLISNVVHRHEPPIIGGTVQIFQKDNHRGIWAIEKKASMPIHPTGRYRNNTLIEVLKHEHGLEVPSTANRLDRLVSGVILIATSKASAQALGKDFGTPGRVKKVYVARVAGKFPIPDEALLNNDPSLVLEPDEIVCDEPLLTIDKQIGVNVVHVDGRPSRTIFKRLSYDAVSDTSIVRCRPITGRSHQIRVHLQYLGHPIANDPVYNNTIAWGRGGGRGGIFQPSMPRMHPQQAADEAMTSDSQGGSTARDSSMGTTNTMSIIHVPTIQTESSVDTGKRPNKAESKLLRQKLNALEVLKRKQARSAILDVLGGGSEASLNEQAVQAITELRKIRDEEDNFARLKDMDRPPMPPIAGVDVDGLAHTSTPSRPSEPSISAKRGLRSLSRQTRDTIANQHSASPPAEADTDASWYVARDEKGEYCKACGIPLLPDPTVAQLQIWLHAIRYYTDEWDFSSPMPDWADQDQI